MWRTAVYHDLCTEHAIAYVQASPRAAYELPFLLLFAAAGVPALPLVVFAPPGGGGGANAAFSPPLLMPEVVEFVVVIGQYFSNRSSPCSKLAIVMPTFGSTYGRRTPHAVFFSFSFPL